MARNTEKARAARERSARARKGADTRERNLTSPPATPDPVEDAATDDAIAEEVAGTGKTPIPQLAVWERRLINPTQQGSRQIHLKAKGFELRWINTEVDGRWHEATALEGWIPVDRSELSDHNEITGMHKSPEDTYVRTGPNGVLVLMKMPQKIYDAIARRKVEVSRSKRQSASKQRENIKNRAAAFAGDRGAEAIDRLQGEITESIERVTMDPEDLDPASTMGTADDATAAAMRRGDIV